MRRDLRAPVRRTRSIRTDAWEYLPGPIRGEGGRPEDLAISQYGIVGSREQVALSASIGEGSDCGARAARVFFGAAHGVLYAAVAAHDIDRRGEIDLRTAAVRTDAVRHGLEQRPDRLAFGGRAALERE